MSSVDELHVSRDIDAAPSRVFEAWTSPDQIVRWWGGGGVTCPEAEVDLRPGGSYRIANAAPDGTMTWITGRFDVVDPPHRLTYTWTVEVPGQDASAQGPPSVVVVEFQPLDSGTRVTIAHSRIPTSDARQMFGAGWNGCLDGLRALLA